ncbi:survival protein sure-like phosphatase/nucleotidase, partial [Cladochytrium replicatum]
MASPNLDGTGPLVLVTNDDGPPSKESPFIETFVSLLVEKLGWRVAVFIPATQQSWISKAINIKGTIAVSYYNPVSRTSSDTRESENDWVLLDATPASCVNIALYNILPRPDAVDLVISGPNFGRNVTAAATLSSGTVGGALEGALQGKRAISLSYAFFDRSHVTSASHIQNACENAVNVIARLWEYWSGAPPSSLEVLNVNVPLVESPKVLPVKFTDFSPGGYGALYKPVVADQDGKGQSKGYAFRPTLNFTHTAAEGTDLWAINSKCISVTPMRTSYQVVRVPGLDQLFNSQL